MIVEQRHYQSVGASSSSNLDYVVPDGDSLTIKEMGGDGVFEANSYVQLIWDPAGENKILLSTAGSAVQSSNYQVTGNGTKVLRIRLVNNNALEARQLGGYFIGLV